MGKNYYKENLKNKLEKYYTKCKLENKIIDLINNTIDFKEIENYFPLPKTEKAKKLEKFREYLRNLSKKLARSNINIILYLSRHFYYDVVYIRADFPYKNNDYISIEFAICEFNKETREFKVILPEKKDLKEIENKIQLALQVYDLSTNINDYYIYNILKDYIGL